MILTENERKQHAQEIAELRKARGISQAKLAELAAIDCTTISGIENGQVPHEPTLLKVFDALGYKITSFGVMPEWVVDQITVMAGLMAKVPEDRQHETMGAIMQIIGRARRGAELLPPAIQAAAQAEVGTIQVRDSQIDITQHKDAPHLAERSTTIR